MSEWHNGKYDAAKKKTINKKQEVIPHICVTNPSCEPMLEHLKNSPRLISASVPGEVSRLLPDHLGRLASYHPVRWFDWSVVFYELRFEKGNGDKSFREWFQADVSGSDKSENDGQGVYSTRIEALAKTDCLIPANVPQLFTAREEARKRSLRLGVTLTEGVKAMGAMAIRLSTPEARQRAAQSGYYMVASAWLGGSYGASHTNFAVRPASAKYVATNKNNLPFPVRDVDWFIGLDGDEQGKKEGRDVVLHLKNEFEVSGDNIRIIDPPIGYEHINPRWDEADALPVGMSEEDRVAAIIKSPLWREHELYQNVIILRDDRFDANITAMEDALVDSGRGFYQHLGRLIKVEKVRRTNVKKEDIYVDRMTPVNAHALRQDISAAATLRKWKGSEDNGSLVPIIPPDHHVQAISHKICGENVPLLYGIINAPTIFADGSMLQEPGYDRSSKLLYNPDGVTFPKVPESVGRADAELALVKLRHLFSGFPFVDAIDESVAIAGQLTAVCRKSFDVAPAFAVTAPEFGSGKSFLVDCIHMVAFGVTAPVIDATSDDDEFRKRLETELMQGAPAIAFDNVTAVLGGDTFSSMLTSEFIKPRKLGGHTAMELSTNAFVTITGNHLKIRADLIRRVLQSRIDAETEDPWKRKFEFNPIELIRAGRGEYVVAVLTILRAYHLSGRGVNFASYCSYEEWSKLVRGAVVWLGLPDPFGSVDLVSKDDPDKSDVRVVMEHWARTIDLRETTACKDRSESL